MRDIVVSGREFIGGNSYLWLDEPNGRVVMAQVVPKDNSIFGMDDLMVNIAQLGYDVALAHPIKSPPYPSVEPYNWTVKEERFNGEDVRMYTMTFTDILTRIHALVVRKTRIAHVKIIELIQKPDLNKLQKVDLINHAISISNSQAPFIQSQEALLMPEEVVDQRYRFAEDILFGYFLRDNPNIFPPNPFKGQRILKQEGPKIFNGEVWETFHVDAAFTMKVTIPGMVGSASGDLEAMKEIVVPIPAYTTPQDRQKILEQHALTDFFSYTIGAKVTTRDEHMKWLHPTSQEESTQPQA